MHSVLIKEVSLFQGCPYRGVPLHPTTCMHLHGIVLCSNNSDSDVLEVGGGGATLGSLVNCMIYIMSKKISSNSVVEETVQLMMIGQHIISLIIILLLIPQWHYIHN